MRQSQSDLFELVVAPNSATLPEGFVYRPALIAAEQERSLIEHMGALDFRPFDFHGFLGKRRVTSFGWRYDFGGGGLQKADGIPPFLLSVRAAAAGAFGLEASRFEQVLLTQYPAGATIGWHKDRSVFGDVIGVSLASTGTLRFRRPTGAKWERRSLLLEPRSAYVLQGPARAEWEHSIPAVAEERYSITFRTLKPR